MNYNLSAMNIIRFTTALLSGVALHSPAALAIPSGCSNSDPSGVVTSIKGDFELVGDPQDASSSIIYTANSVNGAGSVVVARIDGSSGNLIAGSLTTVATNWLGESVINGPEFVQKPDGRVGILYAGPGGVHGVFRSNPPLAWNDFAFSNSGSPVGTSAPTLGPTIDGNYAGAGMIFKQNAYFEYPASADNAFFGSLTGGSLTNISATMTSAGLTASTVAHSPRDRYVFMDATSSTLGPGIYEAEIDGSGGFTPSSLIRLTSTRATHLGRDDIRAIRHPVTNDTILFADAGVGGISVYSQAPSGGPLTLLKTVNSATSTHYRTEADMGKVVLHYYIKTGLTSKQGSYTLPVTASGGQLNVGSPKRISPKSNGAELVWFSSTNQWALFYRSTNEFTRCLVTP